MGDNGRTVPAPGPPRHPLPEELRALFWDQDFDRLRWPEDADAVTARILAVGGFAAMAWLRRTVGDAGLREWIVRRQGRGIDGRRLRYWQIILDLPAAEVDRWLRAPGRRIWEAR